MLIWLFDDSDLLSLSAKCDLLLLLFSLSVHLCTSRFFFEVFISFLSIHLLFFVYVASISFSYYSWSFESEASFPDDAKVTLVFDVDRPPSQVDVEHSEEVIDQLPDLIPEHSDPHVFLDFQRQFNPVGGAFVVFFPLFPPSPSRPFFLKHIP